MVDVQKQADAVTRELRTEDADGHQAHVQTLAQEYPSGIDDVWEAVTAGERIARWFLPVSGDLRLGGRYQLERNAGGEVLECRAPSRGEAGYRVTWEYGGSVSWLAVRLTALGDERTRLELEHTARTADVPAQMWNMFGPGATGVGWDQALLGLALHLGALEGSVTPADAAEWQLSDEGRSFTRRVADRWAAAHIAAGADAEVARRAAEATYGFYTGQE
ncbi:SRPBCC domain-containing protein [Microbacterium sp.]|uniref:SRPBCC domain-containing protein n=1 Tax=Microbacterium sp. TaxID=51671 RepID=UPI0028127E25|nr:SRPBCC domain-containing protein [Microbacterium sp.]